MFMLTAVGLVAVILTIVAFVASFTCRNALTIATTKLIGRARYTHTNSDKHKNNDRVTYTLLHRDTDKYA